MTALILASDRGFEHLVMILVDRQANLDAQTHEGWTALHYASCNGYANIVKILLEYGATANAITKSGKAPIHYAADRGQEAVLIVLLDFGADVDLRDATGKTALELAMEKRHQRVVAVLRSRGAVAQDLSSELECHGGNGAALYITPHRPTSRRIMSPLTSNNSFNASTISTNSTTSSLSTDSGLKQDLLLADNSITKTVSILSNAQQTNLQTRTTTTTTTTTAGTRGTNTTTASANNAPASCGKVNSKTNTNSNTSCGVKGGNVMIATSPQPKKPVTSEPVVKSMKKTFSSPAPIITTTSSFTGNNNNNNNGSGHCHGNRSGGAHVTIATTTASAAITTTTTTNNNTNTNAVTTPTRTLSRTLSGIPKRTTSSIALTSPKGSETTATGDWKTYQMVLQQVNHCWSSPSAHNTSSNSIGNMSTGSGNVSPTRIPVPVNNSFFTKTDTNTVPSKYVIFYSIAERQARQQVLRKPSLKTYYLLLETCWQELFFLAKHGGGSSDLQAFPTTRCVLLLDSNSKVTLKEGHVALAALAGEAQYAWLAGFLAEKLARMFALAFEEHVIRKATVSKTFRVRLNTTNVWEDSEWLALEHFACSYAVVISALKDCHNVAQLDPVAEKAIETVKHSLSTSSTATTTTSNAPTSHVKSQIVLLEGNVAKSSAYNSWQTPNKRPANINTSVNTSSKTPGRVSSSLTKPTFSSASRYTNVNPNSPIPSTQSTTKTPALSFLKHTTINTTNSKANTNSNANITLSSSNASAVLFASPSPRKTAAKVSEEQQQRVPLEQTVAELVVRVNRHAEEHQEQLLALRRALLDTQTQLQQEQQKSEALSAQVLYWQQQQQAITSSSDAVLTVQAEVVSLRAQVQQLNVQLVEVSSTASQANQCMHSLQVTVNEQRDYFMNTATNTNLSHSCEELVVLRDEVHQSLVDLDSLKTGAAETVFRLSRVEQTLEEILSQCEAVPPY